MSEECPNCHMEFGPDYTLHAHLKHGCWGNDGKTKPTIEMLESVGLKYRVKKVRVRYSGGVTTK